MAADLDCSQSHKLGSPLRTWHILGT